MLKNRIAAGLFILHLVSAPAAASTLFTNNWDSSGHSAPSHPPLVALLVGNSDYKNQPLRSPTSDSRTLGDLLRRAGFDLIQVENATGDELESSLNEMKHRLGNTGVGLFYFAGHGIRTHNASYILPIDAETSSRDTVARTGISIDHIIRKLSARRPGKTNLVIIDACLNNPFQPVIADDGPVVAGTVSTAPLPDQTLIAFAAANGAMAFDDDEHGVYTRELIRVLSEPGLTTDEIFSRVQSAVKLRTTSHQTPWTLSSLRYRLQLINPVGRQHPLGLMKAAPIPVNRLLSMKTRGILPKDGDAQYELEFWQSIEDSTEAADYEAYLEAYPNGKFAPLARSRAARYKKAAPVAKPPVIAITEMDVDYQVVRNANLRQTPSPQSKRLGKLKSGAKVHVIGRVKDKDWYQVTSSGVTGFVFGELLREPAPAPKVPPKPKPLPIVKPQTPATETLPPSVAIKPQITRDCPSCPELINLPAGRFTMGDKHGDRSEKPAHRVSIKKPFAIGKYEVTVGQWKECRKAGACGAIPEHSNTSDNMPVRDVSWSDTQKYVRWLSKTTGQQYRLPTEAEWEYAARAGTQSRFWWGDKVGKGHANCKNCGGKWDRNTPAEVDAYPPNPFGLYGTSGGVWEWVADCWYKSHKGAPEDGRSRDRPDCRENVIRGGAWRNDATYVHSASRFRYDSGVRYLLNGFRVAKTLK